MTPSVRMRVGPGGHKVSSLVMVFAVVLASVSLVVAGSTASALSLKECGTVKNKGVKWRVVAHGVSCGFAKSWLPKMVAAREREPGVWTGPPGWICSKRHKFPHGGPHGKPAGPLISGNCVARPKREMAWHRV
jgi:hypothetical protein